MRVVRIKQFLQEQDNVPWLIEGLLPSIGWTLLVGYKGLGKTTFAAQMCSALQDGKPFLGRQTVQTDILYLQADSVADEWREILRRVAPNGAGWTLVDVPEKCISHPAYVDGIKQLIAKVDPGFIVFDSLYNLVSVSLNSEAILIPINTMKVLAGQRPWLLIHHPPHGESRASGHNSIGANCSNEWHLLKTKLKIEKGRLVKTKEISLDRDENGLWVARGDDSVSSGYAALLAQEI